MNKVSIAILLSFLVSAVPISYAQESKPSVKDGYKKRLFGGYKKVSKVGTEIIKDKEGNVTFVKYANGYQSKNTYYKDGSSKSVIKEPGKKKVTQIDEVIAEFKSDCRLHFSSNLKSCEACIDNKKVYVSSKGSAFCKD